MYDHAGRGRLVAECGADVCHAVQADLAVMAGAEALVRLGDTAFRALDALVVNHRMWPPDDIAVDQMSEQQWTNTLATNLDSVFPLLKHSVAE